MAQSLRAVAARARAAGAQRMRTETGALYRRPPVKTYTDACEAPPAFWAGGAIPLRRAVVTEPDGSKWVGEVRTYNHPREVHNPQRELGLRDVQSMYTMSDDDLIRYFPEGLGGRVAQLMPPGHPRGFLYRSQSHLLNTYISKLPQGGAKTDVVRGLANGCPGFILDGDTGTGKSALLCQAVHFARSRGIMTVYVPNARDWTHGEWAWPSVLLPGFWDAPDATRVFLRYFARAHRDELKGWALKVTPGKELPREDTEAAPDTLLALCEWGLQGGAPGNIDRSSVAIKFVMDELIAEEKRPILFVVDGMNLMAHDTHFRYPHPDFLRSLPDGWNSTQIDLYPQELPRIPAARFTFVRALNRMMLSGHANKHFIAGTSRNFKPFDGGVSGFADVASDRHATALDEYRPFDAAKDTVLHPMEVGKFNDYESRAFIRYLVNSGELAGFGWGPLWHYSPDFERKLYKISVMSGNNAQGVVDQYHQEMLWVREYGRLRQKQYLNAAGGSVFRRRRPAQQQQQRVQQQQSQDAGDKIPPPPGAALPAQTATPAAATATA